MTATARRETLLLPIAVLIQAAALVWLGSTWHPALAGIAAIGGRGALLILPRGFAQTLARVRTLAHSLRWYHCLWALLCLSEMGFRVRDVQSIEDNPLGGW